LDLREQGAAKDKTVETSGQSCYCIASVAGRRDEIVKEILALWGPMVDAGSDTAWEGFDGRGSICHGWAGVPVVALLRYIFRLDPRKAGRRRVKNVGGVDWMKCELRAE